MEENIIYIYAFEMKCEICDGGVGGFGLYGKQKLA